MPANRTVCLLTAAPPAVVLTKDGQELGKLGEVGSYFGEKALIADEPRSATATGVWVWGCACVVVVCACGEGSS